ncbi:MAG: hypothetical protein HY257_11500 [Chloroflexi bacterium]|nr:hypothetical protein [Chloroflexota bacterium]
MKTITIAQILDNALSESGWKDFCIYVFRDDDFVLYVGKSTQNIIDRLEEHLGLTYRDQSQVGRLIMENAPLSRSWSVDLLTLEDSLQFVREYFPESMGIDLELAERATILRHSPPLNGQSNPHPNALPRKYTTKRDEKIKAVIKKVFNEKK